MDTPKTRPTLSSKKRDPIRPAQPVACRRLTFSSNDHQEKAPSSAIETWSVDENKALVQFLLFHGPEDSWPSHSLDTYWMSLYHGTNNQISAP